MSVHKLGKNRCSIPCSFTLFLDAVSLVLKPSCFGGSFLLCKDPELGCQIWTWICHASGQRFEVLWGPLRSFSLWILAAGVWPPPQVRSSLCLFHLPPCCPLTFYCGGSVFRSLFKGVIPYVVIDLLYPWDFPGGSDGKPSAYNAGDPVQSLDWEDLLKKEMATQSSSLAWKIPWWATVQGVTKSQTWLSDFTLILGRTCVRIFLSCRLGSSPIILHF